MRVTSLALMSALLLLPACGDDSKSGAPTAQEMQTVIGANIKADVDRGLARASAQANQSLPGFQGFSKFSRGECTAVETPAAGWNCTFSMTIKINNQEMAKDHQGFFSRNADGSWNFKP